MMASGGLREERHRVQKLCYRREKKRQADAIDVRGNGEIPCWMLLINEAEVLLF